MIKDNEREILGELAMAGGDKDWITASAVESSARGHGKELNAPTIYHVLTRLRDDVEFRTTNRIRRFHLKNSGRALVQTAGIGHRPTFVSPGTPWSTQRELRLFLGANSKTYLLIIDPYVSEETLDVLAEVKVPIQILSSQLGRGGKETEFLRAFKKFRSEKNGNVTLYQASPTELHGRYILTDGQGWTADHSLQDLGNKPALVLPLQLDTVFSQVHSHFTTILKKSAVII